MQSELLGASTAMSNVKLTKEGLAQLPRNKTKVNIANYSVTTQGVDQQLYYKNTNTVNGLKVPKMEPIDSKAVLNKRESLRNSAANAPVSKPIERRLLEITK